MKTQTIDRKPHEPSTTQFIAVRQVELKGMKLVPAGMFRMGSTNGSEYEMPLHDVSLSGFLLDEGPVSNAEFDQFVKATGYQTTAEQLGSAWGWNGQDYSDIHGLSWHDAATSDRMDHPVVYVSWFDAFEFARWAGKRLPTEAEFEYAARGGLVDVAYPWGNEEPNYETCWFRNESIVPKIPPTSPVRALQTNGYGLFHMAGNVWNWVSDWFGPDYYYHSQNANDPAGPATGSDRVRRGGAWNVIQSFRLRCANRGAVVATLRAPNLGFRCAMNLPSCT